MLLSVALLAMTVFLAPRLIASLPSDYFTRKATPMRAGVLPRLISILLSAVGIVLVAVGVIMFVTPGPGLVVLLLGLSLVRFPGKQKLILRILAQPGVLAALNWMRRRHHRPPFVTSERPSSTETRLIPVLLCIGVLASSPPSPAEAQSAVGAITSDEVEQRIAATNERLEALDRELARTRAERERLRNQLDRADAAADERQSRISSLDQDIARFESTLDSLEARISDERATLAARQQRIIDTVRRAYAAEDANPVAVLLAHEDPAMADRLSVWTGYVLRARRADVDYQRAAIERIERAHEAALKDRNWLEHIRRKATRQRDGQIAAATESREGITSVEAKITETTRSVETLRADGERLGTLLDELRAAEANRSGYFENGKGSWKRPVEGRLDARFGDVKSVGKLQWEGLYIRAEAGSPVTAIADGEVVYSDWLRGFGELVILDHGDNYMTLYGGNRDRRVIMGDWAEAGATIATVGDTGGQSASGLYFEIRQDARPVDPALWLDL